MVTKKEILHWKKSLIVEFGKQFPEYSEADIITLLAMDRFDQIAAYYEDRYVRKRIRKFTQIKRLCIRKGFEVVDEGKFHLTVSRGGHGIMLMLFSSTMRIIPGCLSRYGNVATSVNNMNPRYIIRCLDLFCGLWNRLPGLVHRLVPEGRKLAAVAEVAHPYLTEKIESSGVLSGYEHSTVFCYSATMLRITDICHPEGNYYRGEVTLENVEDIIRRLPAALSDFENFEHHFPEFASCWDGD